VYAYESDKGTVVREKAATEKTTGKAKK
jgi:hypothetical protein